MPRRNWTFGAQEVHKSSTLELLRPPTHPPSSFMARVEQLIGHQHLLDVRSYTHIDNLASLAPTRSLQIGPIQIAAALARRFPCFDRLRAPSLIASLEAVSLRVVTKVAMKTSLLDD